MYHSRHECDQLAVRHTRVNGRHVGDSSDYPGSYHAMVAPPRAVPMISPSDTEVIRIRVSRAVIGTTATVPDIDVCGVFLLSPCDGAIYSNIR